MVTVIAMCYSAMVQQDLKQLALTFRARVDVPLFEELFERRLQGERILVSRALELNFADSANASATYESKAHERLARSITAFGERALHDDQQELFKQQRRLADAQRKLLEKVTKTAQKDQDIAVRKVAMLKARIELRQSRKRREGDARIFPMYYAPLLVAEGGERLIRPYRYHLRPEGQPASFDAKYSGCYNARFDNLASFVWRSVFGKRHGLLVVQSFYENVARHTYEKRALRPGEPDENVVVQFAPRGLENLLVPCLYDDWHAKDSAAGSAGSAGSAGPAGPKVVRGCAAITFDPPKEIAQTGHDRCPGFLKEKYIDAWLQPQGRSNAELAHMLEDRETPYYEHALVA